jgi:hypothetical protein
MPNPYNAFVDVPELTRDAFNSPIGGNGNTSVALQNPTETFTVTFSNTATITVGATNYYSCNRATDTNPIYTSRFWSSAPLRRGGYTTPDYDGVIGDATTGGSIVGHAAYEYVSYFDEFEIPVKRQGGRIRVLIDGREVLNERSLVSSGTAQAGGVNTVTLAAGDSATTNIYAEWAVFITGGTGAGQSNPIVSYNGTTKVATCLNNWTTVPDATSTYEIRNVGSLIAIPSSGSPSVNYIKITATSKKVRRVRIECYNFVFYGILCKTEYVPYASRSPVTKTLVTISDSFAEPTGADGGYTGMGSVFASVLGAQHILSGIGGTGFSVRGSVDGRMNFRDRITPPTNAWKWSLGNPTGGTFTITVAGNTTAAIAYNATAAAIQTAVRLLSGQANAIVGTCYGQYYLLLYDNPTATSTVTVDAALLTYPGSGRLAMTPSVVRYYGDLYDLVPTDGYGAAQPFYVLVEGGFNDGNAINAATLTIGQFETDYTYFITELQSRFPTAMVFVVGPMPISATPASYFSTVQSSMTTLNATYLRKINGRSPNIDLLNAGIITGTGNIAAPGTLGSANWVLSYDSVHYSIPGNDIAGYIFADKVLRVLEGD